MNFFLGGFGGRELITFCPFVPRRKVPWSIGQKAGRRTVHVDLDLAHLRYVYRRIYRCKLYRCIIQIKVAYYVIRQDVCACTLIFLSKLSLPYALLNQAKPLFACVAFVIFVVKAFFPSLDDVMFI